MPQFTLKIFLTLLIACVCFSETAWGENFENRHPQPSGPWFTGTLLSTRGLTLDQGRFVAEPYFFFTKYGGLYNDNWRLQSAAVSDTIVQQTYLIYGLTSRIDVEIAPQWLKNSAEGESISGFGDLPIQLGFQALRSSSDSWLPDVRIWVQEIFPTGRYNHLSPSINGLAGTGGGSFATTLGIGVQKAIRLGGDHVFRYRVNATHGFFSPVTVQGFNAYGGGFGTEGRVDPGSVTTLIVAGEYSLTQHVNLALDIGFQTINATEFSGTTGVGVSGEQAIVGRGYGNLLTIAPAMEYSFNQHVGLIAGPWFSLRGKNTTEFFGVVAALLLYL
ncbi:MAG: hypothetical protein CV088_01255 [Nitrospira sp. LK70]|nr:hypothetical protein [Nitrospira sp. LK70]